MLFTLGILAAVHKMSGAADEISDLRADELVSQVLQLRYEKSTLCHL